MVMSGELREVIVFGPVFSSQVRSIVWLAIDWPKRRLSLGVSRWMIEGKNPSILEKWWVGRWGVILSCLLVAVVRLNAVKRPRIVTVRAAVFSRGGMDIMGVFSGVIFMEIKKPAKMLPQASRLMGLIVVRSFSLMGERGLNRGFPIEM